jgi:hypothetical protein
MDLFVWLNVDVNNGMPMRFQLSSNKRHNEQLASWDLLTGFRCYEIDSGETDTLRYKKSPPDDQLTRTAGYRKKRSRFPRYQR